MSFGRSEASFKSVNDFFRWKEVLCVCFGNNVTQGTTCAFWPLVLELRLSFTLPVCGRLGSRGVEGWTGRGQGWGLHWIRAGRCLSRSLLGAVVPRQTHLPIDIILLLTQVLLGLNFLFLKNWTHDVWFLVTYFLTTLNNLLSKRESKRKLVRLTFHQNCHCLTAWDVHFHLSPFPARDDFFLLYDIFCDHMKYWRII